MWADTLRGRKIGRFAGVNASKKQIHPNIKASMVGKKYYGEICGLAKRGITANAVAPSGLADDFNAPLFAMMPAKEFIKANTALDRVGISKDVGGVIAFLCTAQSSLVNGAVLNIDGGYHL